MDNITVGQEDALIVVDVQNDFIPGGSLAVPRGDEVVSVINVLARRFSNVILTQDWHPRGHSSFASAHPGKKPFEQMALPYGEQVLWPDHCVQGTTGAELHSNLFVPHAQLVIRKGYHSDADSYSAFKGADGMQTGLTGYLRERGIRRLFFVGLATDFCVAWSAMDARRNHFGALIVEEGCRAVDMNGSLDAAWRDTVMAGVGRVLASAIV